MIETHAFPSLARRYPRDFTLITRSPRRPRASYLAALPSPRAIAHRDVFYACHDPEFEGGSLLRPASLKLASRPRLLAVTRHGFTFYVAAPASSIRAFAMKQGT